MKRQVKEHSNIMKRQEGKIDHELYCKVTYYCCRPTVHVVFCDIVDHSGTKCGTGYINDAVFSKV